MGEDVRAGFTETSRLREGSLVVLSGERREWLNGRYVNLTWNLEEFTSVENREEIVGGDKFKVRIVV